jgi:hypothetical protein
MHKKAFLIVGIVNERIFRVGSETGSVTFSSQRGSEYGSGSKTPTKMGSRSRKKFRIHTTVIVYTTGICI